MRSIRLMVVMMIAALLTAVTATVADAAAPVHYVALGDSYSSGLGSDGATGTCERSPNAYSALWSAANSPATYTSVACSGATTATVISGQLSALSTATTLVSVTAGGNDVGFSSIMETCILDGTSDCVAAVNAAENVARSKLPGNLNALYSAISAKSPSAKVVVLDYPAFYQLGVWYCIGLSSTSRAKIDEGINLVDSITSTAVAAHGFTFADVTSAFIGHQLCSSDKWLHSLNIEDLQESYHPTTAGQADAYLPAFSAAA